jgi:hypothetical protein
MALKTRLIDELSAVLNIVDSAQLELVCEAIAKAVVDEILENGEVVVAGGSSAGTYPVTGVEVS